MFFIANQYTRPIKILQSAKICPKKNDFTAKPEQTN